jgi:hypothetical protein
MEEQVINALLAYGVAAIVDSRDGDIVTLWVTDGNMKGTIRLIPDRMPQEPPLDVWASEVAAWLAA